MEDERIVGIKGRQAWLTEEGKGVKFQTPGLRGFQFVLLRQSVI